LSIPALAHKMVSQFDHVIQAAKQFSPSSCSALLREM